MNQNRKTELLRHAARRASQRPFFLAADLEQFQSNRGMEEKDVARFLGCADEMIPRVALCRRPDPQSPHFRSDVLRIANGLGLRQDRLAQLIRETDALKAMRDAAPVADQEAARGILLAAREPEKNEPAPDTAGEHHIGDDEEGT